MFIYLVKNTVNGKVYVGQTIETVHRRWQHHRYAASGKRKHHLLNAIRKYGHTVFTIETLCECPTRETLNEAERFYIWLLASHLPSFGYNCELGGSNGVPTDGTRQKMRESHLGKNHTIEARAKIAEANRIRIISDETRKKMSLAKAGVKKKPRTREHSMAQAEAQKGKPLSEERRIAISNSLRGRTLSSEQKEKIRATCRTPEFRERQRVARIAYWKNRNGDTSN